MSRGIRRVGAAAAVAMLMLALAASARGAPPPAPLDLEVQGGERWHDENGFVLNWKLPPVVTPPAPAVVAVNYRVRRGDGLTVLGPARIEVTTTVNNLRVPEPGEYTAEVWLENQIGQEGPASAVRLRFDDVRPGEVAPAPLPVWMGRNSLPRAIRIEHPEPPHPVSGIRGFAVSVGDVDARPCKDAVLCTDAETDLRGGLADDSYWLDDELPEGVSHLSVVAVSGSGVRSETAGRAVLRVDRTDPVTELDGVPAGWSNSPVHIVARATDVGAGMEELGGTGVEPFTAIRIDGGTPRIAPGDYVAASVMGDGIHTVEHYARDAAGNVNDGATTNGKQNRMPAVRLVGIDREPPTVRFLAAQDPDDPERIEARVSDALSGPSASRGWIGIRAAGSPAPFEPLPTTRSAGRLIARWRSDEFPPGLYEFHATGFDEAGNPAGATERLGGVGMVLANPLKAPMSIEAGLAGPRRLERRCTRLGRRSRCRRGPDSTPRRALSRRSVRYGQAVGYAGRVATSAGVSLGGLAVDVVERFGAGHDPRERITTVVTDPAGRFSTRLAAGPTRNVSARYDGSPTLSRAASSPSDLLVRSAVRMTVSAATAAIGGRPVIFSGRIQAGRGEIPEEGKAVALQFRLPGLPWTDFRTVRTDGRGRFRHAYRFADDDSRGISFRFRALVTPEPGWPYEPNGSRPVTVRGK